MSMVIHKLQITQQQILEGKVVINVPKNSTISDFLRAGVQDGKLTVWYMVWKEDPIQASNRLISIVGTGHEHGVLSKACYIDTVQMPDGLVWHLFEGNGCVP